MEIAATIVAVIIAIIAWNSYRTKMRRARLIEKYNDEAVVDDIMKRLIWQGMTEEQLIDSWGKPVAKDHRIYKTKISETFKYNQIGKNRFGSRVRLERGIVVGWEQK